MITFIVHLKVGTENRPAFEALLTNVRDLTRANEPDVLYYDFARSADDPGVYCVIEVYRDAAAHAAHMQTPWVRDSLPQSRRLVEGEMDIRQYVGPGTDPAERQWKMN